MVASRGMHGCSRGHAWLLWGGIHGYMVAPGGMHGCSLGGHVRLLQGGACVVALGGHAWLLWGACVVAPRGACVVALGGVHGCSGGHGWLLRGGHAWLLLGGMHGCSQGGVCVVAWGACMVAPRGGIVVALGAGHAWDTTRYRHTINEQAVRILLECIFVLFDVNYFTVSGFLHKTYVCPS